MALSHPSHERHRTSRQRKQCKQSIVDERFDPKQEGSLDITCICQVLRIRDLALVHGDVHVVAELCTNIDHESLLHPIHFQRCFVKQTKSRVLDASIFLFCFMETKTRIRSSLDPSISNERVSRRRRTSIDKARVRSFPLREDGRSCQSGRTDA